MCCVKNEKMCVYPLDPNRRKRADKVCLEGAGNAKRRVSHAGQDPPNDSDSGFFNPNRAE